MNRALTAGILLAASVLASPAAVHAQAAPSAKDETADERLKLSGTVRARYEALDGQFRPGLDESSDLVSLRTTLFGEYDAGPVRIGAELYDSRAYGTDGGTTISNSIVNTLELVQAYVAADLGDALGDGTESTIKAGRFTMDLGSRRLVADDTYRNTTNGFTGLRGDFTAQSGASATLFFTLPQRRLPDDIESLLDNEVEFDRESFNTIFWGGIVTLPKVIGGVTADAAYYRLDEADGSTRPTRNRKLHTLNARLLRKPKAGQVDFEVEGAYQFGSIRSGAAANAPRLDVGAAFVHAELGWQFAGAWKPRLSVEYDYASGDGSGGDFGRFDALFGSRSGDFGPSGIYGPINRNNLSSPGIRFEGTPSDRTDVYVVYRALWLAARSDAFATTGVRDPAGLSGSFAGHHIEGRVRHWLVPDVLRLEGNAALLAKGRFLERAPNAPATGDTLYGAVSLMASF